MRPTLSVTALTAFVLALCLGLGAAQAQESRGLSDRLDRLERDLNTLQSQVYRGGGAPASSSSGGGAALSGDTYSMLDQRINALEGQIRDLNGQVEKVSYSNSQLQTKLERLEKDDDFRFKELESKAAGAPQASGQPGAPAVTANGAPVLNPPGGANKPADWNPTMGSPPGNLGQVSANDLKAAAAGGGAAAAAPGPPLASSMRRRN